MTPSLDTPEHWTPLRKLGFKFVASYSAMYIFYTWLRFQTIPGLNQLHQFLWPVWRSVVTFTNDNLLHIRETLVPPNSSTDTSFSWASQYTMLLLGIIITIGWSFIDRKKENYNTEEYWVRTAVRYFIAYFALYYGIIKLFALQMPAPSLGQLSTTLGDLSTTRLSWIFVGASTPYQIFSGVVETLAGLFLLTRRTTTLGLILSAAVFGNVVALNFSYDIPVKIMSAHFFLFSVYLLLFESRRLIDFFANRATMPTSLFTVTFDSNTAKYGRIAAKIAFLYVSIVATIILSVRTYRSQHLVVDTKPVQQGMYDVQKFFTSGDSTSAWKDLALYGVTGSIKTSDTIFEQRYERGYFFFEVDTVGRRFVMKRNYDDPEAIASLNYAIADSETLELSGTLRGDSVRVVLIKRKEPFRLAQPNQFHWLQEWPQ